MYLNLFKYIIKPIFSHTWISYLASIFTILASLSILQYLQIWCYRGDSCEEKLISNIWFNIQRDYLENSIKQKPFMVEEKKINKIYQEENNITINQEEIKTIAYYEMKYFYIKVIYNINKNSECVFITARNWNSFTHPYLKNTKEKTLLINKNDIKQFEMDKYIGWNNWRNAFSYFEYIEAGYWWARLSYYVWLNDGVKFSEDIIESIPQFESSEIIYSWDIIDLKWRIEREKMIPNTFWFWQECEYYDWITTFDTQYRDLLKSDIQ